MEAGASGRLCRRNRTGMGQYDAGVRLRTRRRWGKHKCASGNGLQTAVASSTPIRTADSALLLLNQSGVASISSVADADVHLTIWANGRSLHGNDVIKIRIGESGQAGDQLRPVLTIARDIDFEIA